MKNSPKISNAAVERVKEWQKMVTWLLYGAMILKALAVFLPFLEFPSGVLLFVFFLLEIFLLPPVGMALMCLMVSVLFFFLPNIVQLLAGLAIGSVIVLGVGMALSAALSGIVLTFFDEILMSVEVISTTAPLTIAMGVYGTTTGLGAATGYVIKGMVEHAGKNSGHIRRKLLGSILGSILVFVVIGWPSLSYSQAITGALACKPAVILNQAHLNHLNYNDSEKRKEYKKLFEDEENWVFGSNFYSEYINNGRNNLSQGGKNMANGDESTLALLLNGILYVQSYKVNHLDYGYGYIPRETDALVLADGRTFIFGHDKVFCAGKDASYTWKKTKWTSEFEKLSQDEQFDRIYDILERQNTTEDMRFSYDDVAVVAYAQRTGMLINYKAKTHTAWFAKKAKDGSVTVYEQNGPGSREEQVTFTPECPGEGVPYVMINGNDLLYIKNHEIMNLDRRQGWKEFNHFTNPMDGEEQHSIASIHYMDLGESGEYLVYLDEKDKICLDSTLIGKLGVTRYDFKSYRNKVMTSAGDYIYSIQYDDSPLSRLTYIKDVFSSRGNDTKGWGATEIWMEDWAYQRIELKKSIFIPEEETQEDSEEAEEAEEKPLDERYPAPELTDRPKGMKPYDKTYITASKYKSYKGPKEWFYFNYPGGLYNQVEYSIENEGNDVEIKLSRNDDSSLLEVSMHPLPEDAGELKAYAETLCAQKAGDMYNGHVDSFEEDPTGAKYKSGKEYRFRISGWTEMNSGERCTAIGRVSEESVMLMYLRIPAGTGDEDKKVKKFYQGQITFNCGFRPPAGRPKWN